MDLVYFAIVVSVLIFVHELGHFVWAKIFGVKVLMFSIGFGPKIVRLRGRETEYCIGMLPLGGFVKMLEEKRQEPVLPEDKARTFEAQALWKRAIIILAGPAMSIVFPVLLYVGVFAGESEFAPPTIGVVVPGHAAWGKLLPGDRVLEIDGVRITTFAELQRTVRKSPGRELKLKVFRNNEHVDVALTPDERIDEKALGIVEKVGSIGVGPHQPAAVIGILNKDSPAWRAGLRTFDVITEVRGQPVATYADLEKLLSENRGETVPVTYLRPAHVENALGTLSDLYVYESGLAALTPESSAGDLTERTGIEVADLYIANVEESSPEYRADMRTGDRLLSIDNVDVSSWAMYVEVMQSMPARAHTITWLRNDQRMTASVHPRLETLADDYGQTPMRPMLGARNWTPRVPEKPVGRPSLFRYAFPSALDETVDVIRFIVVGIAQIARGELGLSTLGGPITVYDVIMQERQKGGSYLLWAMAIISINLGLINLLPIPALDGGHLVFLGIEAVARRPVPLRVREVASLLGLCVLVVLMGLAVKNDVEKRWDIIAAQAKELVG
ncbi:MAG TPA: RIP metalloprotease RseP [Polyangiaceae bacterium]|nr:RIP metalloprotease RseP [Polyangiaceae bacterium]